MSEYRTFQIILADLNKMCESHFSAIHHLFTLFVSCFGLYGLLRYRDPITGTINFQSFVIYTSAICLAFKIENSDIKLSDYIITSAERRIEFYQNQKFVLRSKYVQKQLRAFPILHYKCCGPFYKVRKGFFLKYLQKCLDFVVILLAYF